MQKAFQDAFGLSILEGYGCTELSPVVSINLPDYQQQGYHQRATKEGSVGRPIPGTALRIVHPETMQPRSLGEEGLLLVKGPNVMQGYLGQPEKTAEAIEDGWYKTGDIAFIDDEGFLTITDRLSRFTKIGGEMIPHGKVEEIIRGILGHENCAVTGIPEIGRAHV